MGYIGRICSGFPGPRQRFVMDGKPGQRPLGGMHLQGCIEGWSRLVAHVAHAPCACLRGSKHGIENGAHLGQTTGRQHGAGRAEGMAKAGR